MSTDMTTATELHGGATWRWDVQESKLGFSSCLPKLLHIAAGDITTIRDIIERVALQDDDEHGLNDTKAIRRLLDNAVGEICAQQPYELKFLTANRKQWLWLRADVNVDMEGGTSTIHGRLDDITTLVRAAEQAKAQARIDTLSGVLRGGSFEQRVINWLTPNKYEPGYFVVYINIDLDGLKLINSIFGHPGGDEVIRSFGQRLRALTSRSVAVGRPGGDEFAIVARCTSEVDYDGLVEAVVEQVSYTYIFSDAIEHGVRSHPVTASIGVAAMAVSATPERDAHRLRSMSDQAMYAAKRRRDKKPVFYSAELVAQHERDNLSHIMLAESIRGDSLPLALMPIAEVLTGRIVGVELLLDDVTRDEMGLATNEEVIRSLDRFGLLEQHDMVSIFQAMQKMTDINAKYPPDKHLYLAVNMSAKNLIGEGMNDHGDAITFIGQLLKWTKFPPHLLHIELSEDQPLAKDEHTQHLLTALRQMGIELICDDFGKQYSNFDRILEFPYFSMVKVDKLLISKLEGHNSADRDMVTELIQILRARGYLVCAEGLDSIPMYRRLRTAGCTHMQGYLVHDKMSVDDFEHFLETSGHTHWLAEFD